VLREADILFNLQFVKFEIKNSGSNGVVNPYVSKYLDVMQWFYYIILEQVDLESAGFTKNKWLQKSTT
jgi:hypothetical protein